MRQLFFLFLFVVALSVPQFAHAQTVLRFSQFSSGGAVLSGGDKILSGSLGLPFAGSSDGVQSGFWYVAGPGSIVTGVEEDYSERDDGTRPAQFRLHQNYPNPFNPTTTIEYDVPNPSNVRIEVFDGLGRRLRLLIDSDVPAGSHRIVWDGRDAGGAVVATGFYVYRLVTPSYTRTRTMVLLK